IVFAKLDENIDISLIANQLKENGILVSPSNPIRFVTHKDISRDDIATLISRLKSVL
ncbi:low-specificity L-threonine aldolase, partial [Photobacterium damselae]